MQQRTNPTSKLTMTVNATDLFDRYLYSSGDQLVIFEKLESSPFLEYDDIVEGELPQFEVSEIKFEQSIEAPLTPTDTATLSGSSPNTSGQNIPSRSCCNQERHRRRRHRTLCSKNRR